MSGETQPRIRETLPTPIREIENVWIPMRDGCRLAARLWLPQSAEADPVPAILEYLPYRKRDFTRTRDEPIHRYFAGHGYACARVDIRGTGDSEGLLQDEYTQQELEDALDVIDWLARQPWCSGAVGMMGKSWGGFNALQVAALDPPQLKAVISVCAADDRYADDAHYMGGCLLNENLQWGAALFTYNAYPPDPEIVGEVWREQWLQRLGNATLFPATWMRHPHRDAYWRHGSVCEDYAAIRCPVYAIGGWADAYSNAIPRLLEGLEAPRKGLIGPWAHNYPHDGVPGPAIGFLQEALRWWDQWLKGKNTGISEEPMLRVWMQQSVRPKPFYQQRPGRWVGEAEWPSHRSAARRLYLGPGTLSPERSREQALSVSSPPVTGMAGGEWCAFGSEGEMPADQRPDDIRSLMFDGEPLKASFDILGAPVATLELAADRPVAQIAVRLEEVWPDGASTRVTYGLLNLAHRESHAAPQAVEPGARMQVRVPLNHIAHEFTPGNRVRLAISTSYWPIAWPSPESVTVTVWTGASSVALPVRPPSHIDGELTPFPPAEQARAGEVVEMRESKVSRRLEHDLAADTLSAIFESGDLDAGPQSSMPAISLETGSGNHRLYRIGATDPLSAEAIVRRRTVIRRGAWSVSISARLRLSATVDDFILEAELTAEEGEQEIFSRTWVETIPRALL